MQDTKTSITAVITGMAALLAQCNIVIPHDYVVAIFGVGTILIGLLARDGKGVRKN